MYGIYIIHVRTSTHRHSILGRAAFRGGGGGGHSPPLGDLLPPPLADLLPPLTCISTYTLRVPERQDLLENG